VAIHLRQVGQSSVMLAPVGEMGENMNKAFFGLAVGTALAFSAVPAFADGYYGGSIKDAPAVSVDSWSGLYIGAAVGYGVATAEVDKSVQFKKGNDPWSDKFSILNLDGLSSEGAIGTLTLGYDHQVTPGLLIGIFGDYTFGDLENEYSALGGLAKVSSEIGDSWSIGARIGLVRDKTLWYVMAGYTEADLDWALSLFGTKYGGSESLDGYFVGLGVEHQLFNNVSLKLDYRFSDYDALNFSHTKDWGCWEFKKNLEIDTEVHAVRLGVNWKVDLFGSRHAAADYTPLK